MGLSTNLSVTGAPTDTVKLYAKETLRHAFFGYLYFIGHNICLFGKWESDVKYNKNMMFQISDGVCTSESQILRPYVMTHNYDLRQNIL